MCDTTRKLCLDLNCNICLNKSFKSIDYCKFLINKNINPRFITKNSNKLQEFKCDECNHIFSKKIIYVSQGQCCPYCSTQAKILCDDDNCDICFERSFASHETAKYWDYNKNKKTPREVFKKSATFYYFNCNKCSHNFETSLNGIFFYNHFCSYCVNQKLCDNNDCKSCYNKSFASNSFSKNWSNKNTISPRHIFNRTSQKYLFNCNICKHTFESRIADIKENTSNCSYCSSKLLCNNNNCEYCFNKSFASHKTAIYWSAKNNIEPRTIFKNCNKQFLFNCDICNNDFLKSPNHLVTNYSWCPICKHKTEKQLYKWLCDKYGDENIKHQYTIKNNKASFKFDFYIKHLNILIELDGIQHFKQTLNWTSPEYNLNNDINKILIAINNKHSIIHLLQEDVYKNKNNWENKLINNIKIYNRPTITFINNANIYEKHIQKLNENNIIYIID